MPDCKTCCLPFEDWPKLVDHILDNKSIHPKYSVKFALSYKLKHAMFEPAKKQEGRIPLTEQEKENKIDTQRQLSGEMQIVKTLCPSCNAKPYQNLPIEFVQSPYAWRKNELLVTCCNRCIR